MAIYNMAIRSDMVERGEIKPFSDAWKEFVADSIALSPGRRNDTMRRAIKQAMDEDK